MILERAYFHQRDIAILLRGPFFLLHIASAHVTPDYVSCRVTETE